MQEYYMICKFTSKGAENIKASSDRIAKVKKMFKDSGANIISFHIVLGRFDTIVHVEAPNDETIAKLSLQIGALGNVHIETLRAFSEEEFLAMVKQIA